MPLFYNYFLLLLQISELKQLKMKKITTILLMAVAFSSTAMAQDAAVTEMRDAASKTMAKKDGKTSGKWTKGGTLNVNATQQSFTNWVPAGIDEKYNITGAAYLNLFANKTWGRKTWENNVDIFAAYQTTKLQGGRKVDDRIDITSKYSYAFKNPKLTFTTVGNLRTQLFNGYNYKSATEKYRTSGLFAPAILTIAPGFSYKPNANFSVFFSPLAYRGTFVTNGPNEIAANLATPLPYGVDPAKTVKHELGYFASFNYKREIAKNITYQGRLDIYGNYMKRRPDKADIFWTNVLSMRVNNWLNVTYALDMIYDDDTKIRNNKAEAQIRSMLGVGFAYKF
jgi:hypothetical protein